MCEQGQYLEAQPLLSELIAKNPTNSEYHRIQGQILSDQGKPNEAINSLIDALRWDAHNNYALIMMGNIYAKDLDDVEAAMVFYDQVIKNNPKDYIALNNIGANLLREGKTSQAIQYFNQAKSANPKYPQIYAGLGMAYLQERQFTKSFEFFIHGIQLNDQNNELHKHLLGNAYGVAEKVMQSSIADLMLEDYIERFKQRNRNIEIQQSEEIPTAAKIEFAENYQRTKDIVLYNPKFPAYQHLIFHELMHLEMMLEAREISENKLFTSNDKHLQAFKIKLKDYSTFLIQKGFPAEGVDKVLKDLFEGLNRQIFNSSPDLFIEHTLYTKFPHLKPIQFVSLYNLLQNAKKAVTQKEIVELSDAWVLSTSKILNLVNALQFKDLFGLDLIPDFKATAKELAQAKAMYQEFLDYVNDKQAGEEYELIQNWANDLKLDTYFKLVNETNYREANKFTDDILKKIEDDPFDLENEDDQKDAAMQQFLQNHQQLGLNTAVAFFMVEALQFFKSKTTPEIKKIAHEIALQGVHGYHPQKNYKLNLIPHKTFTGYQILAYYYVSWAIAIPEMLTQLHLPFEEEFDLAKKLIAND